MCTLHCFLIFSKLAAFIPFSKMLLKLKGI